MARRVVDRTARRIHVTGGPGSGKTRLAAEIAGSLGVPHQDLDGLALSHVALRPPPVDPVEAAALLEILAAEAETIAAGAAWVSDGSYVTWVRPLLEHADLIIRLDVPWRVAAYRIVARHVKAELARENRFPGWRLMLRFWLYSRRFYNDTNGEGVNDFGNPRTRRFLDESLTPYRHKLVICASSAEVQNALLRLRR